MKNILLSAIIVTAFLPQLSYAAPSAASLPGAPTTIPTPTANAAANPRVETCNSQVANMTGGFWNQQAADRDAFGKEHPDSMKAHDAHWSAQHALDMAQRTGKSTSGLESVPPDDAAFLAFQAKQESDKEAYLSKINQAMQNCMNGG